jgi:hypothetical protein
MSSSFSNYPLEGDGVIDNLFYYLWMKDELDQGPKINIPDTIIYKYRQPAYWYFTAKNGQVKRKSKYNLMNVRIEETFNRNTMGSDIIAYYLTTDEKTGEVTIEYFDKLQFHDFLYNREKVNNGIVQKFIEPKGTNNSMIRAIWSPKVCLLERRVNVHKLHDTRRFGMYERAVTYEGPEVNSQTAPVRGSILPSQVQRLCSSLVNHVAEVSFQKHKIKRMAVNLKVDPNDRIWFMWCSSCRVEHTGNMSPRSRSMKNKNLQSASVNIDALMKVPKNVRIQNISLQPGKKMIPAGSVKLFDCPSCGRSVQPELKHTVNYKVVVGHFDQLLMVMGAGQFGGDPRQLAWPPDPEVISALGGVGLGGAEGPFGKKLHGNGHHHHHHHGPPPMPPNEDLEIPPVLRLTHPKMTCNEYKRYRRDPLFLYKQLYVCEDCWLVYAETSEENGQTNAQANASRVPFARRISPLSRHQRSMKESLHESKHSSSRSRSKSKRRSRKKYNTVGGGSVSGLHQLNRPAPDLPRRITIEDINAQGRGNGNESVLEQIARQGFGGGGYDSNGGLPPATPEEWAQSQALAQSGVPPPTQLEAVPEAFRQTLQEREDAFFRELYQNPNLQRGHPLSHMVVGAAKIRAHQQQMAEYQQSLAAEFGEQATGIAASTLQSMSQPSLGAPSQGSLQQKPPLHGSSSLPSGLDGGDSDLPPGGVLGAHSPYAKLQKLGPPPRGMAQVVKKGGKKKAMSASQSQLSTAPSSSGVRKKSSKKKKKSRPGAHGSRQRRAPMDGGGVKSVQLSEEDLSASAASHRDFLLQTLHNVRNQLANPSPLIVSGLAVDESMYEEDDMMNNINSGSSIHMPQVQITGDMSIENPEEIVDRSAALVLRVFDLVDPEHDGKVKKLDFLKGVQTPEVQEAIRTHPQFSALLHTHTYRDALLAIETKDGKYINVQEITRFANSL